MALAYTKNNTGCYIDAAFGEDHRRAKLADLIRDLETQEMIETRGYSVVESLAIESPDDFSDEEDALEILQQFTESGLVWSFEAGDLILATEEESN
jgi:hypothetical protein